MQCVNKLDLTNARLAARMEVSVIKQQSCSGHPMVPVYWGLRRAYRERLQGKRLARKWMISLAPEDEDL